MGLAKGLWRGRNMAVCSLARRHDINPSRCDAMDWTINASEMSEHVNATGDTGDRKISEAVEC